MTKSITIPNQLVTAGMSTGTALIAFYYAKSRGKDSTVALLVGSFIGTVAALIITNK